MRRLDETMTQYRWRVRAAWRAAQVAVIHELAREEGVAPREIDEILALTSLREVKRDDRTKLTDEDVLDIAWEKACHGLTNKEIAEARGVTPMTVHSRLKRIGMTRVNWPGAGRPPR